MAKPGHARSCVRARPCTQATRAHTGPHTGSHGHRHHTQSYLCTYSLLIQSHTQRHAESHTCSPAHILVETPAAAPSRAQPGNPLTSLPSVSLSPQKVGRNPLTCSQYPHGRSPLATTLQRGHYPRSSPPTHTAPPSPGGTPVPPCSPPSIPTHLCGSFHTPPTPAVRSRGPASEDSGEDFRGAEQRDSKTLQPGPEPQNRCGEILHQAWPCRKEGERQDWGKGSSSLTLQ